MSEHQFRVGLGHVDYASLITDDDFRREAKRLFPIALREIARSVSETAWSNLQNLNGPASAPNRSLDEKRRFIEEASRSYEQGLSAEDRRGIEEMILAQLRDQKGQAGV